jgi:hypothetical protein
MFGKSLISRRNEGGGGQADITMLTQSEIQLRTVISKSVAKLYTRCINELCCPAGGTQQSATTTFVSS